MLRNFNRLASRITKNGLFISSPIAKSNHLIKSRNCSSLEAQVYKSLSNDRSKYYATYFYNLVNIYYNKNQNKIGYESLKNDIFFEFNYKETMSLLNNTNNNEIFEIVDKLSILRSLQVIGAPAKDELVCKLIEDLSPNLNKLTIEKTLKVLLNQVQFQNNKLQKMFTQSLVKRIEDGEEEIDNLTTALMIYNEKIIHLFSNEFLNKIDNKTVELCKKTTENSLAQLELTWILHRLSSTKRRPKPLIQYLTNRLNETNLHELELNIIISLIDSLATINYLSVELLSKIINHLVEINFISKINKFDFNLLLKSFIKLRYDPVELFDYLASNIQMVDDKLGKKNLMSMISAMAFFNYSKEKATELLENEVFKDIDIDLLKDSVLRIEYLWALSFYDCLEKVPHDQFTLNFFTKILDKVHFYYLKPRFALLYNYCKLNLGLDVKLSENYFLQNTSIKEKNNIKPEDFLALLKKENYLINLDTELGFRFDLVFVCNKNFETKPIKSIAEARDLCDEEYKLIYVYLLSLKEVALNTSKLLGEVEMMRNLGRQMGYRIVIVNPHDMINKPSIEMIKEFRQSVIDLI